jgi:hypothetical protein
MCKMHSLLWFNEIAELKGWALRSIMKNITKRKFYIPSIFLYLSA